MKAHDRLVRYSSSPLDGSVVNCGPVLNWLPVDSRGDKKLIRLKDESAINTPSIAAGFAIKDYTAQDESEISVEVGDLISVIDMPLPNESIWWKGKRGFEVGFFPSDCVQLIDEDSLKRRTCSVGPMSPAASIFATLYPVSAPVKSPISAPSTSSTSPTKTGKLGAFLRLFVNTRRATIKSHPQESGKGAVFGIELTHYLETAGLETPVVLDWCSSFIEKSGLVDGIYRLSGITSNIERLRQIFNDHKIPDTNDESLKQDVHCVASLLKMYFRELPIPLLTFELYDSFIQCLQPKYPHEVSIASEAVVPEDVKIENLRKTVEKLPTTHYNTLKVLAGHLSRVATHGDTTGMTAKNVAIVWAPNLLRCQDIDAQCGIAALHLIGIQAVVTEYIIRYADRLFVRIPQDVDESISGDSTINDPSCIEDRTSSSPSCSTHPYPRPKSFIVDDIKKRGRLHSFDSGLSNQGSCRGKLIDIGEGLPPKYHTIIHSTRSGSRTATESSRRRLRRSMSGSQGWNNFSILQAASDASKRSESCSNMTRRKSDGRVRIFQ